MKTIQITDKYRALVIPHNYQLEEYQEGGKEVRNVKTGEIQTQEAGWKRRDVFYANLNAMVKHVARLESDENATNLNDWLATFKSIVDGIEFN